MTERLYYQNQYLAEFSSEVVSCTEQNGGYKVVLTETAFYPEGGGQPADKGTIDGFSVLDVKEQNGEVVHFLSAALPVGKTVFGRIDVPFRFSLMQQHSGEHIFSGIAHSLFGCTNVGFHMGGDYVSVDFNKPLSAEDIRLTEEKTNEMIYRNVEIRAFVPSPEELQSLSYRFKKELSGNIRLVEIPGTDLCACCGLHTKYTGEIGIVKVETFQNYKGGVRLFLKIGQDAFRDYAKKNEELHALAASLSVKPESVADSVKKLSEKMETLKREKASAEEKYFRLLALLLKDRDIPSVFEENLDPDSLRRLATVLRDTTEKRLCAAFSGKPGEFRYAVASSVDALPLCRRLNEKFSGRGGGKKELCCGNLTCGTVEEIEKEIASFED